MVDGKLHPDPDEAPVVRRIVTEFLAGASLRGVATGLNRDGIECPNAVKHDEAVVAGAGSGLWRRVDGAMPPSVRCCSGPASRR
jgi:hypothetical protein